jgi:hypothetical protein
MSFLKKSFAFPVQLAIAVCVLLLLLGADTAGAQIRTVLVSPVPGDPVASGTALRNALAGISSPSATNRWLLKIEPGTYDIAGTSLAMRAYVDVEGSGIEATTILNGNPSGLESVTIFGADNAELRFLTVQAIAPTSTSDIIAMANYSVSPRVYRVKLVSQATSAWGMRNVNAAPLVEECEISVTSTSATPSFAYGLVFRGLPPGSRRSSILRSQVKVSGAAKNYGVFIADALSLTSIRDSSFNVAGAGGSSTQGLYATGIAGWSGNESLTIRDTHVISGGGSSESYGLRFEQAAITLEVFQSKIWGHVAPTTYGIYTDSPLATGGIQGSSITGFTKTIQFGGNISIASTFLQGGPATAGGWIGCMGVWDENAIFYTQGCP